MSRYQKTFARLKAENKIAFIPFWMIGDPDPEASLEVILKLAEKADVLELGMPFSDPLADGETIQAAVNRALESGTNTQKCFEVIEEVRNKFPDKPIGLLVYFNLIIQFGVDEFFAQCAKTGVDSVLIPELPVEAVTQKIGDEDSVKIIADKHGIDLIFLVSTNTPEHRLSQILENAGGFIYATSTPSITGAKSYMAPETLEMVKNLKIKTDLPICVGFGVSEPAHVKKLAEHGADGAIVGSKLINLYQEEDIDRVVSFCGDCV